MKLFQLLLLIKLIVVFAIQLCSHPIAYGQSPRILPPGTLPNDSRLGQPRLLSDRFHPWTPPSTLDEWQKQRQLLKERILVGQGLWPMPPLAPLAPVIHGKIEKDDYTIEKVIVASLPGHYVTGNLYRPKRIEGKIPAVLCPHGHWENGRMIMQPPEKVQAALKDGAEQFEAGATNFMQARMVGLARMGCTVFHYDMVGYCDSKSVPHGAGFSDVEATLRLQQSMGLQTLNSIRALDFLLSLPEVDTSRVGVTGESGGGTQTFILGAIDPRPTVSFPAVMVSDNMQGGCVCENCCYLRIGTNNVALAAVFAPKPMAMTGAHDWTIGVENKPLRDLKAIYSLYQQPDLVHAKAFPQFRHNYNQVAREMMYSWFNKHLKLGLTEPIRERDFELLSPAQLSVFDENHSLPADALDVVRLRTSLTHASNEQFTSLIPKDASQFADYRQIVGTAVRVMLDGTVPQMENVIPAGPVTRAVLGPYQQWSFSISRRDAKEQIPVVALVPESFSGTVVLWFDGQGKRHLFGETGKPTPDVKELLDAGRAVVSADLFLTGEFLADQDSAAPLPKVNENYPGYTFGYNRPLIAERVHDIQSVVGGLKWFPQYHACEMIGTGEAGLWTLLARAVCDCPMSRTVVDLQGFGFSKITSINDARMLPGGLKYGGIGGIAALIAPSNLAIYGMDETPKSEIDPLTTIYRVTAGTLSFSDQQLTDQSAVAELLK